MTAPLSAILADLYALDPSLKAHEAELIPLLETLLRHRPDAVPDAAFIAELRRTLLKRAEELTHSSPRTFFPFLTMPRFSLALSGALVGVLLAAPTAFYVARKSPGAPPVSPDQPLFSYSVVRDNAEAFGDLSQTAPAPAGRGGGGGGGDALSAEQDRAMIYPEGPITMFDYEYAGDPLTLDQETVAVLKRQRSAERVPGNLFSLPLGLIDLQSFSELSLDSFAVFQDTKNGYMISTSLRDGVVSVNQFWERWNHPGADCQTEECSRQYALKPGDIPPDEEVIAIADAFLGDHGIDVSHYGEATVDRSWERALPTEPAVRDAYVPDTVNVTYPLVVEGQTVYEEGGMPTGISVSVSVRDRKVSGVWNLQNLDFRSSAYPAVRDPEAVLRYIDRYAEQWQPEGVEIDRKVVTLGTPSQGYVRMYLFKGGTTEELFVPALIFPVTSAPEGSFYGQENFVVPLAEELLKEREQPRLMME